MDELCAPSEPPLHPKKRPPLGLVLTGLDSLCERLFYVKEDALGAEYTLWCLSAAPGIKVCLV